MRFDAFFFLLLSILDSPHFQAAHAHAHQFFRKENATLCTILPSFDHVISKEETDFQTKRPNRFK